MTVSYTHLDVYKRQGEPGRCGIEVVRPHEEGEIAVAHEVGDPLAHLVVCLLYTSRCV